MARVKVTLTVDLPRDISGMLLESERRVLTKAGTDSVKVAAEQWVGWKYGTQYSPARKYPSSQLGTSGGAWRFEENFTKAPFGFQLINDAEIKPRDGSKRNGDPYSTKSVGKRYARYVHRANTPASDEEWIVVWARVRKEVLPLAASALLKEIIANIGKERVVKEIRPERANIETEYMTIE
jgi:hypothetical protein